MKTLVGWAAAAAVLMIGFPWLAVAFAGDAGMAVCFLLFFAVDPLFSAVCGWAAGRNIRQLWLLTALTPALFLAGVWIFFSMGEPAFLLYGGVYLGIGLVAMGISALVKNRKS